MRAISVYLALTIALSSAFMIASGHVLGAHGAYGYKGAYKLRPDAPDPDAIRTLSSFYMPVFEKMLAGGIIVEYEVDREIFHATDSRAQVAFSFVVPGAEGLEKFRAALGDALDKNSLIGPAFGSMMVTYTPQADLVRVNTTYK